MTRCSPDTARDDLRHVVPRDLPSPSWRGVGGEGRRRKNSAVDTGRAFLCRFAQFRYPLTPNPSPSGKRGVVAFTSLRAARPTPNQVISDTSCRAISPLPRGEGSGVRGGVEKTPPSIPVAHFTAVSLNSDTPSPPTPVPPGRGELPRALHDALLARRRTR